jgi:hypothetical protein
MLSARFFYTFTIFQCRTTTYTRWCSVTDSRSRVLSSTYTRTSSALEHIHDSMSRARIASDDSRAFVLLNGNGSPTNRTPLTINTGGKFARDFVDAFGTLSRAFGDACAEPEKH